MRWFFAACFTAPLLALVLGIGVHIGRAAFPEDAAAGPVTASAAFVVVTAAQVTDTGSQIGMALVGVVTFAIGCFCPMALFRLLAFVDPGTSSGASMRAILSANGGPRGLMSRGTNTDHGSGAATQTVSGGRSRARTAPRPRTATVSRPVLPPGLVHQVAWSAAPCDRWAR